jgi:pyruvate dehydrogenase E2 component (dihydrolipoamide acetyltransferase)
MYEVTMPKLSDSMETGKIVAWQVKEGDKVSEGDILAEVESDKAVMELECFQAGVLKSIVRGDDSEVAVGETIALIDAGGKAAAPAATEAPEPPAAPEAPEAPAGREEPEARTEPAVSEAPETPPAARRAPPPAAPAPPKAPAPPPPAAGRVLPPAGDRARVSPYARALAAERGIDVETLAGTGPGGRIVARDVERVAGAAPAARVAPSPDEELPPLKPRPEEADVEDAPFRLKTQARLVTASKHVVPHFYMAGSVDAGALLARKAEAKAQCGATVTHLILEAVVDTIRRHPNVNRSYDRGKVIRWKTINLGLAVDTDDGLTVAVLHDAGALALPELVARANGLVEKARAGKLSAAERRYPTFTVSNLGMLGVESFVPIINPPAALILGVSAALDRVVVRDGLMRVARVMNLSLSCDHRIVDGAAAARFLQDLKARLE